MTSFDAGLYECRGVAGAKEVVVTTVVEVVKHTSQSGCDDRQEAGPTITGWFSHMIVQAGDTAKLLCNLGVTHRTYSYLQDNSNLSLYQTARSNTEWRDAAGNILRSKGRQLGKGRLWDRGCP